MFRIKSELMETRPLDVARDSWREMQRAGMRAVGEYWFKEMLPRHFTPQAKHIYQHKPRSTKYIDRKRKLAQRGQAILGGMVDNVLTGAVMNSVKNRAVIRGFPTRCTVYMHGPNYLRINFKAKSNQPNKKQEILTTTPKEAEVLKKVLMRVMREQLAKHRKRRKTKV